MTSPSPSALASLAVAIGIDFKNAIGGILGLAFGRAEALGAFRRTPLGFWLIFVLGRGLLPLILAAAVLYLHEIAIDPFLPLALTVVQSIASGAIADLWVVRAVRLTPQTTSALTSGALASGALASPRQRALNFLLPALWGTSLQTSLIVVLGFALGSHALFLQFIAILVTIIALWRAAIFGTGIGSWPAAALVGLYLMIQGIAAVFLTLIVLYLP